MALTKITAKYLEQLTTYGAQSSVITAIKANLDAAYNAIDAVTTRYDAQSTVIAVADNTPVVLPFAASTFLGRLAAGNLKACTTAEVRTELGVMQPVKALIAWTDAAQAPTAAQVIASALFSITSTADRVITMPSTANLITAIGGVGAWARFTIVNLGAFNVTVTAGDGSTTTLGNMVAGGAAAGSATFTIVVLAGGATVKIIRE